jgi:hypothetical protein
VSKLDREVLFANEAFALGMLQAVAGGGVIAALAQADAFGAWVGRTAFLLFVTTFATSLALAVLSAYWRYQHKMWDVMATALKSVGDTHEAAELLARIVFYQRGMRYTLVASVLGVVIGLGQFVVALWIKAPINVPAT